MTGSPEIKIIRQNLFWLLLVILLVSFAYTVSSSRDTGSYSGDLDHVKVMVAKEMDPDLYTSDYFFNSKSPYRDLHKYYIPFYLWIVKSLWNLTGSFESGLVLLVPFLVALYLFGMVLLLTRLTKQVWLSMGLALASNPYRGTMGLDFWGVASSYFIAALTIFCAFAPFLFI